MTPIPTPGHLRQFECLFWHPERGRVRLRRMFRRSRPRDYIARGLILAAMNELGLPNAQGLIVQAVWER